MFLGATDQFQRAPRARRAPGPPTQGPEGPLGPTARCARGGRNTERKNTGQLNTAQQNGSGLAVFGEAGSRLNPPAHLWWCYGRVKRSESFNSFKILLRRRNTSRAHSAGTGGSGHETSEGTRAKRRFCQRVQGLGKNFVECTGVKEERTKISWRVRA